MWPCHKLHIKYQRCFLLFVFVSNLKLSSTAFNDLSFVANVLLRQNDMAISSILLSENCFSHKVCQGLANNVTHFDDSIYYQQWFESKARLFRFLKNENNLVLLLQSDIQDCHLEFPKNSWIRNTWIFVINVKKPNQSFHKAVEEFVDRSCLDRNIQLHSRVFFLLNHERVPRDYSLIETYRIQRNGPLVYNEIFPTSRNNYIWERRGNLQGTELILAYTEYEPHVYQPRKGERYLESFETMNGSLLNLTGNYVSVLGLLMKYINFTVKIVEPKEGDYGEIDPIKKQVTGGIMGLLNSSKGIVNSIFYKTLAITTHNYKPRKNISTFQLILVYRGYL